MKFNYKYDSKIILISIKMQLIKIIDRLQRYKFNLLTRFMSATKTGFTAQQIEAQLQTKIRQMQQHQRNANYVEAQTCRITVEQLKKDFQSRKLYQLDQKHKQENNQLAKTHQQELQHFNKFWDKKMEEFHADGQRLQKQMSDRHQLQLKNTKSQLQKQLSTKLKQSSQLLNLRKMQEHMAKQKNYVEAQKVKQRCSAMEKQQTENWLNMRNLKIQTALNTLRHKQQGELGALQKKTKTGFDQQIKDRKSEQNRLRLKYANVCKQLKMQQDKQILSHKGSFKSKGGSTASPTLTKSKTGFK